MIFGSVCSGIEAASVASKALGWLPAFFSEIEKYPSRALRHHYPETPNHGDMTKFEEWEINGTIRLLCGGTPCQSFSVAGLRKGLDDARGNLMLTFGEMAAKLRPEWIFWENVAGVLSSNGGQDFGAFLGLISARNVPTPKGGWGKAGVIPAYGNAYGIAYRLFDAQYFGVAQRRRRVFVVGYLGDWRPAAAVLFERESMQGNPAPSRKTGEKIAPCVTNGSPFSRTGNERVEAEAMLVTGSHWDGDNAHPTLNQSAQNSGGIGQSNQELFSQRGGGLVRHLLRPEHIDGGETSRKRSARHDGSPCHDRGPDVVAVPICWDEEINARENLSGAVIRGGDGGRHAGVYVPHAVAFAQNTRDEARLVNGDAAIVGALAANAGIKQTSYVGCFKGGQGSKAGGIGWDEDVAPTLSAADSGTNRTTTLMQGMAVRRLTPVECERLQGFPDGYTEIPDPNGKPTPDGHRYKALGNSWAVPNVKWIFERIDFVDKVLRNAT